MSCEVTVAVTLGPEGDPLVLPSTCSDGLSWTKMTLPDWEFRYTYAPPSIYVPGNVLLAAVRDSGAIPMIVSVEGTSLGDLEDKKAELETALAAWPGLFQVDATDDNGTVTIAGPWESFPTLPRWGDVLPTVLGHYLLEATFSLPVNPTETTITGVDAVPRKPATPTTTETTTTTITEAWTAISGATSYNLEVSANGTTGWASVYSGPALNYTDTDLDPDTDYYYRVTASNAAGAGAHSGVRHATTLAIPVGSPPAAATRTYDPPVGSPTSAVFTVAVDDTETACYQTEADYYGTRHHFANFETDEAGPVTITVTSSVAITSAFVRPVSHGITPTFTPGGTTLTFAATDVGTYAVVINGDWAKPLYVFANPYVATPPDPGDYTYYYGPGFYDNTLPDGTTPLTTAESYWGCLRLTANQSVYVDGGAYVKGKIFFGPGSAGVGATTANVHASGYGVVDSCDGIGTMGPGRPAQIANVSTGSITGITFIGKRHWGCVIAESNNVMLTHAKMINFYKAGIAGEKGTPDGIDIIGSRNVTYDHCFIAAADDCIAIKTAKSGYPGSFPTGSWRGNVENITFEDCVFNGGPGGNGVEIGYETFNNSTNGTTPLIDPTTGVQIAYIRNITYQRVDFIRKTFDPTINYRCAPIGIHATDNTPISNVLYEDFNVDDTVSTDAWIWIGSGAWDSYTYGQRGPITGLTFRRVNFRAGNPNPLEIHFQGGSATQRISGVVIEDLFIKGLTVTAAASSPGNWVWNATNTNAPTFL